MKTVRNLLKLSLITMASSIVITNPIVQSVIGIDFALASEDDLAGIVRRNIDRAIVSHVVDNNIMRSNAEWAKDAINDKVESKWTESINNLKELISIYYNSNYGVQEIKLRDDVKAHETRMEKFSESITKLLNKDSGKNKNMDITSWQKTDVGKKVLGLINGMMVNEALYIRKCADFNDRIAPKHGSGLTGRVLGRGKYKKNGLYDEVYRRICGDDWGNKIETVGGCGNNLSRVWKKLECHFDNSISSSKRKDEVPRIKAVECCKNYFKHDFDCYLKQLGIICDFKDEDGRSVKETALTTVTSVINLRKKVERFIPRWEDYLQKIFGELRSIKPSNKEEFNKRCESTALNICQEFWKRLMNDGGFGLLYKKNVGKTICEEDTYDVKFLTIAENYYEMYNNYFFVDENGRRINLTSKFDEFYSQLMEKKKSLKLLRKDELTTALNKEIACAWTCIMRQAFLKMYYAQNGDYNVDKEKPVDGRTLDQEMEQLRCTADKIGSCLYEQTKESELKGCTALNINRTIAYILSCYYNENENVDIGSIECCIENAMQWVNGRYILSISNNDDRDCVNYQEFESEVLAEIRKGIKTKRGNFDLKNITKGSEQSTANKSQVKAESVNIVESTKEKVPECTYESISQQSTEIYSKKGDTNGNKYLIVNNNRINNRNQVNNRIKDINARLNKLDAEAKKKNLSNSKVTSSLQNNNDLLNSGKVIDEVTKDTIDNMTKEMNEKSQKLMFDFSYLNNFSNNNGEAPDKKEEDKKNDELFDANKQYRTTDFKVKDSYSSFKIFGGNEKTLKENDFYNLLAEVICTVKKVIETNYESYDGKDKSILEGIRKDQVKLQRCCLFLVCEKIIPSEQQRRDSFDINRTVFSPLRDNQTINKIFEKYTTTQNVNSTTAAKTNENNKNKNISNNQGFKKINNVGTKKDQIVTTEWKTYSEKDFIDQGLYKTFCAYIVDDNKNNILSEEQFYNLLGRLIEKVSELIEGDTYKNYSGADFEELFWMRALPQELEKSCFYFVIDNVIPENRRRIDIDKTRLFMPLVENQTVISVFKSVDENLKLRDLQVTYSFPKYKGSDSEKIYTVLNEGYKVGNLIPDKSSVLQQIKNLEYNPKSICKWIEPIISKKCNEIIDNFEKIYGVLSGFKRDDLITQILNVGYDVKKMEAWWQQQCGLESE